MSDDDDAEPWQHAGMERAQIRSRLSELEDVVESQQQQINELESRLKLVEGSNAGLAAETAEADD
jgi:predicted RNase H-like nuclease (RuvC/YqgF family)